jgi:hypothetical protein
MNFLENFYVIVIVFILISVIGIAIFSSIAPYLDEQTIIITIKDKYIKATDKNTQKYLVVDTNNNTYEITDLFFKGKFNSTDIYNQLDINKTYEVEVTGKRIHFFSWYQNINKVKLLESEE